MLERWRWTWPMSICSISWSTVLAPPHHGTRAASSSLEIGRWSCSSVRPWIRSSAAAVLLLSSSRTSACDVDLLLGDASVPLGHVVDGPVVDQVERLALRCVPEEQGVRNPDDRGDVVGETCDGPPLVLADAPLGGIGRRLRRRGPFLRVRGFDEGGQLAGRRLELVSELLRPGAHPAPPLARQDSSATSMVVRLEGRPLGGTRRFPPPTRVPPYPSTS
jgi:hypothetical protein